MRSVVTLPTASTISQRFVEWAGGLTPSALPPDVQADLRRRLLDHLGLCLAGAATKPVGAATGVGERAAVAVGGVPGGSTVIGSRTGLDAPAAAFANGVNAHAHDMDDTHLEAVSHPTSVIMSAALAVGQARDASWGEVMVAAAAGYELMIRLGLLAPGRLVERGFHPTCAAGTLGSALTAAMLQGLSAEQAADAVGIAGSLTSGVLQPISEGTGTKRLFAGWAAMNGVRCARLAEAGFDGPRAVIEGPWGYLGAYLGLAEDQVDHARAYGSLGREWELLATTVKPYPSCQLNHPFIECALDLRERLGFPIEDIAQITCSIAAEPAPIVTEPRDRKLRPASGYEAKFSLPFSVAVALVDGHVALSTYAAESVARQEVLDLAALVDTEDDPRSEYPVRFTGRIRIRAKNGEERYAEVLDNKGGPGRPLSNADLLGKFSSNAAYYGLAAEAATELGSAVMSLAPDDLVGALLDRLTERCHSMSN